jgi:hypothetical protein
MTAPTDDYSPPPHVIAEWSRHCSCCPQCSDHPCDGVCAGGPCDEAHCRCNDGYGDDCNYDEFEAPEL